MATAEEWLTYPNGTDEQAASDYAQNIIKIASVVGSTHDLVNGGLIPRIVQGMHIANQSVGERVLRDRSIYAVKIADSVIVDSKIAHDQTKVRRFLTFSFGSVAAGVWGIHQGQTTSASYGPMIPSKVRIVSLHFVNAAGTKWSDSSIGYATGYTVNALGTMGVQIATIDTQLGLKIYSDGGIVLGNIEFGTAISGASGLATIEFEPDDGL